MSGDRPSRRYDGRPGPPDSIGPVPEFIGLLVGLGFGVKWALVGLGLVLGLKWGLSFGIRFECI